MNVNGQSFEILQRIRTGKLRARKEVSIRKQDALSYPSRSVPSVEGHEEDFNGGFPAYCRKAVYPIIKFLVNKS